MTNLPNLLSYYRLATAPAAAGMALAGYRDAFFILIIIGLATDLVDGPIARVLGQASQAGAKIDTVADASTLLAALLGLYIFEWHSLGSVLPWLYLFLASYAAAALVSLVKFGGLPAYHLYLSKAAAFLAAVFFLWIFFFGYSRPFFLLVAGLGILANLESLALSLRLRRFRADIRSFFLAGAQRRDDDG